MVELHIEQVAKNYGLKQALQKTTLTFGAGITGLLGPNEAGKSTLMKMLATIDIPSSGTISYCGKNIVKHPNELRLVLGYLPQDFGVYPNMNAVEFLEYMAAMKSLSRKSAAKRIAELLEMLHLSHVRKNLLGGFSGGMKQRVGIAQALLNDPAVLIVDEPTAGLDPEERIQFRNLLSSLSANRIIILSTHIVTDVESIAPHIAILSAGNLIACTTPEKLIERVEGKVWNCIVPTAKRQQVQSNFMVSNSIQRSDGNHLRILSATKPYPDAAPIVPSLEDAYLYAIASGEGRR